MDKPVEYQIEPQQLSFAGNAYFNFINSLKSPNTKTTYIQCLKQYMQYRKAKTVDELLIGDQRLIQSNIIEYLVSLQQISHGTRYLYAAVLRHFMTLMTFYLTGRKLCFSRSKQQSCKRQSIHETGNYCPIRKIK